MRMRKNQKGFTIVELLIAIAILSIVVAAVCGFILVGSRSYAAGNSDISVQQEAQLALNQMSDVLIDTTRSVTYTGFDASGARIGTALKDAEFASAPENKSLLMINGVVEETPAAVPGGTPGKTVDPGNGNKHYHFFWSKQDETLYYAELDVQSTDVDTPTVTSAFPAFDPTDPAWVKLADHVTDFSADLTQVEEKRVVMLALTFLDGTKEYVTSNNVTIRNKVAVNDAELDPVNKKKTISVAARDSGVIIEPGEEYHFSTPKVTGENVADRSVTWSVASAESIGRGTDFTDKANGILKVADSEPAGTIDVVITTNAVGSDGNPATCTVRVNIKRATAVNLAKTADSDTNNSATRISPGCTFTISADVVGNKLGEVCSVCNSPDISIDKEVGNTNNGTVYPWVIVNASALPGATTQWNANDYIDIVESAPDHATFYVHPDAVTYWVDASGKKIPYSAVFQCMSLLSVTGNSEGRHYDFWVPGAITLDFWEEGKNIHAGGSLHWGASTEISWDDLSPYHYYVVCARVREYGTEGGDKIMMYLTEGTTTRVTPDMFGVEDVSKPWYLSLQVLNPGKEIPPGVGLSSSIRSDVASQVNDPTVLDLINDYLNNCDASGTYVGTKYLHSDKLEAMINPPEIYYEYDGQKNLGGELKLKTVSTLGGPAWTEFKVDYVKNTRDETLGYWFANNNVKFSMYKEKKDGTLEKLYWYNGEGNYYEGDANPFGGALQLSEIQNAAGVKVKLGSNRLSEAAGKYRLIPTIIYEQGSWADHVGGVSVYYINYDPNYAQKQCYEDKRSTVYYELVDGGNVDAFWSYHNNEFTKGEINFPTPSDSGFADYFDRENSNWQNVKKIDWFVKSINGSNNTTYYVPSSMQCRYVPSSKTYELQLFYNYYDSAWNRNMEISAGVFVCAADGKRWEQREPGPYDSQLNRGEKPDGATADVNFTMNGTPYNGRIYLPLPSEKAFVEQLGFELKNSGQQEKYGVTVKYRKAGETGLQDMRIEKLVCLYDGGKDEYTIQVWDRDNQWRGAYICKSNGTGWKKW